MANDALADPPAIADGPVDLVLGAAYRELSLRANMAGQWHGMRQCRDFSNRTPETQPWPDIRNANGSQDVCSQ